MWRRRLREALTWGILFALLGGFAGFVWLTHHPDHPILERATSWPAVGPWVERFRVAYGAGDGGATAPGSDPGSGEGGVEVDVVYEPIDEPLRPEGMDAAPAPPSTAPTGGGDERVWVAPGMALRADPAPDARVVAQQEVFERLAVLERRGEWVRVEAPAGTGWVRVGEEAETDYPLGSGLVPPEPLAPRGPDRSQLATVRDVLGRDEPAGSLGPYTLYTDVEKPGVRYAHLARLANQVEPAYVRRYGVEPVGEPREAVVIFREEARYRLFQARDSRLQGLPAGGHATHGLIALYDSGRRRDEMSATLAHELVHLLNIRALGPALPPWLDEGMADDLSSSEITPAGDLRPERLGGSVVRGAGTLEFSGAVAAVRSLNAAYARAETAPKLSELVALDWFAFVRGEDLSLNYAQAGLFIRYLVDGEDGALRPAFHRFLAGVAEGRPVTGEALRRELGRSWEELDAGLAAYVRQWILETTPRSGE